MVGYLPTCSPADRHYLCSINLSEAALKVCDADSDGASDDEGDLVSCQSFTCSSRFLSSHLSNGAGEGELLSYLSHQLPASCKVMLVVNSECKASFSGGSLLLSSHSHISTQAGR